MIEDPRDDGLDLKYSDNGPPPTPDVKLNATADVRDRGSGRKRHVGAVIERLPRSLTLSHTSGDTKTEFDYTAGSPLAKPDVEADYNDTLGNGTVIADANVKLSGLPSHVRGTVATRRTATGGTDVDGVRVEVLDGGQIDAVDFVARNWTGRAGNLPLYRLGPDHFVSMAIRRQTDGSSRFRMAGRLIAVRKIGYLRSGPSRDKLAVETDVGLGTKPLRGVLDTDDRGADPKTDPKRMFVDSTVAPLPNRLNILYEPATKTEPLHFVVPLADARRRRRPQRDRRRPRRGVRPRPRHLRDRRRRRPAADDRRHAEHGDQAARQGGHGLQRRSHRRRRAPARRARHGRHRRRSDRAAETVRSDRGCAPA